MGHPSTARKKMAVPKVTKEKVEIQELKGMVWPPEDFSAGYSGMPMNPPVTTSGSAPPTVLSRLAELEERIEEFEVKHGALYSRVGALEDAVGIDVAPGPSQARRR